MKDYYVRLCYEKDDDTTGIGVWATEQEVCILKDIAKRNRLFMVIEQDFDFTGEK